MVMPHKLSWPENKLENLTIVSLSEIWLQRFSTWIFKNYKPKILRTTKCNYIPYQTSHKSNRKKMIEHHKLNFETEIFKSVEKNVHL